jgi:hypothetical protein
MTEVDKKSFLYGIAIVKAIQLKRTITEVFIFLFESTKHLPDKTSIGEIGKSIKTFLDNQSH